LQMLNRKFPNAKIWYNPRNNTASVERYPDTTQYWYWFGSYWGQVKDPNR
jgi:hypothetical protein